MFNVDIYVKYQLNSKWCNCNELVVLNTWKKKKKKIQSTLILLLRNLQDNYMNMEANDLSLFIGETQDVTSTRTHMLTCTTGSGAVNLCRVGWDYKSTTHFFNRVGV